MDLLFLKNFNQNIKIKSKNTLKSKLAIAKKEFTDR